MLSQQVNEAQSDWGFLQPKDGPSRFHQVLDVLFNAWEGTRSLQEKKVDMPGPMRLILQRVSEARKASRHNSTSRQSQMKG